MDTSRYDDLYRAETRDHLRALSAGLLALESGGEAEPLEVSFRAAHTIKGMAAAMGHDRVAGLAHALEDRLSEIPEGGLPLEPEATDELLAALDALERAFEVATAVGGSEAPVAGRGPASQPPEQDDDVVPQDPALDEARAVRIVLNANAPLKSARALLIRRRLEGVYPVLGAVPDEYGGDFDGDFRLLLGRDADQQSVESVIRACGDVREIHWEERTRGAAAASERVSRSPSPGVRVRVDQRHLDTIANGIGELATLRGRLDALVEDDADSPMSEAVERVGRLVDELESAVLAVRMIPVGELFDRFPRVVRDSARRAGKDLAFEVEGREIHLDRVILEEVADPLLHLLRNAVDHGIEAPEARTAAGKQQRGTLRLRAEHERSAVLISIEDDGRGISRERVIDRARREGLEPRDGEELRDEELLRLLAKPGFSTAEQVGELSGRGVGLDVVASRVRALGGSLSLETEEGSGTTFLLRLPVTLALSQALRVGVGAEDYVIPLTHVTEVVELNGNVGRLRGREVLRLREEVLPLVRLNRELDAAEAGPGAAAVIAGSGTARGALAVDRLVGREQIVVKAFDAPTGVLPVFGGVSFLADGRPALVLDPTSLL